MHVVAQLPLIAVHAVIVVRQLLTLGVGVGAVALQLAAVVVEVRQVPLQLGLVAGSQVGLDPLPSGVEFLMGVVLFGVVVVQGRTISIDPVLGVVELVEIVLDRMMSLLVVGVAVLGVVRAAVVGWRRRGGPGCPRVPNQPRGQNCNDKVLSHSLFL